MDVPTPFETTAELGSGQDTRCQRLLTITRRLVIMTVIAVGLVGGVFGITLIAGQRFMVSSACFACGLVGGFVSIQQRLKKVSNEELELLSRSWFQILLIPIYGGIFALVLYLAFLGNIVQGATFPRFSMPEFSVPPGTEDMKRLFNATYPSTGVDFAKLIFWCFVAGFSERLVPQIISKTGSKDSGDDADTTVKE
jgi:hypothetical protein